MDGGNAGFAGSKIRQPLPDIHGLRGIRTPVYQSRRRMDERKMIFEVAM
jgi:hypothetical protein